MTDFKVIFKAAYERADAPAVLDVIELEKPETTSQLGLLRTPLRRLWVIASFGPENALHTSCLV
jgi:hypothetical protein